MTTEEKEIYAELNYPNGTIFLCASGLKAHTIDKSAYGVWKLIGKNDINRGFNRGYLYYDEKWAEIISKPNVNYEIY